MVLTEDWIPHIPVTAEGSSVYASQFSTGTTRLWLLVNRGLEDKDQELRLPCSSASASWFDLYHGALMEEWICNEEEGISFLARIKIEAGGIGAVLTYSWDRSKSNLSVWPMYTMAGAVLHGFFSLIGNVYVAWGLILERFSSVLAIAGLVFDAISVNSCL